MLKVLFKIQMQSAYKTLFIRGNAGKRKLKKINVLLFTILAIYVLFALMFSLGLTFYQLGTGYIPAGYGWVYFSNVGLMAFGMSVVLSVFMAQSLLFEARDNELLLSLPIKPSDILGSRLLALGAIDYVVSFLCLMPGGVVYVMIAKPDFMFYLFFLIASLLLPLLGLAVAAFFGYIVSFITGKMRNKSLFVTVFSLLLLAVYMWVYIGITSGASNLVANGALIGDAIRKAMPPFYNFGMSIEKQDILSLLLFALWAIVPFILMYVLLSKAFIKIATTKHQAKKLVYKEEATQAKSVFSALLKKEIHKFLNSPMYLLNCGFGFLIVAGMGIYCAIAGPSLIATLLEADPGLMKFLVPIVIAVLSFTSSMGITTSPSISLEGKNLWILKSSPISVSDIFHAKIMVNIIFGVGSLLIADACIIYTLKPNLLDSLLIIAIPIAMQIFSALQGLICNLYFPKLDFINEAMVVKQSASVMVAILISFGTVMALLMCYFLFGVYISFELFAGIVLVVLIALCALAYKSILNKGVRQFNAL